MRTTHRHDIAARLQRSVLGLLAAAVVSAPVLLSRDNGQRLATASEIRTLAASVAMCPALTPTVSKRLEQHYGNPSSADVRRMTDAARNCQRRQQQLPELAQKAAALAALRATLHANTYEIPQEPAPQSLRLSYALSSF